VVTVAEGAQIGPATEVLLRQACGAETVDSMARTVTVPVKTAAGLVPVVVRELDAAKIAVEDVAVRRPTLDDVFFDLTGHAAEVIEDEDDEVDEAVEGDAARDEENAA
jgi:ABC-2 type transport system ATP-binding protein